MPHEYGEQDFYIARLPEAPDDAVRNHVGRYVGREDALTVLEESGGKPIACLMASIGSASFSASRVGKSGHIAVCWVELEHRRSGVAAKLVQAAEDWFRIRKSPWSNCLTWSRTSWRQSPGTNSVTSLSECSLTKNFHDRKHIPVSCPLDMLDYRGHSEERSDEESAFAVPG